MNCKFDEMLLYEYLDQMLDAHDKMLVTNHLSACPHCRKKLAEIKLMYYELDNLQEVECPPELESIRCKVVEEAFDKKKSPMQAVGTSIIKSGSIIKEKGKPVVSGTATVIKKGTGKAVSLMKKADKKPKKKMRQRIGGLL